MSGKKAIMEQYVKERDEMLLKCDVNELRKFVRKNSHMYNQEIFAMLTEAPDSVLEVTLRKMIIHAASMPKELQEEAKQWLLTRGHDLGILG
jgi:hypothetical protein